MVLSSHPNPRGTRLDAFRRHVNLKHNLELSDYPQLHSWSVENLELYNQTMWDFCGLVSSAPPLQVATNLKAMWPRTQWFPGARLNFTENILAVGLAAHPDAIAVISIREDGQTRQLTWVQLKHEVTKYAAALRRSGIQPGDRVVAVSTNSLETVLIMLAAGSVGAIFSSTSPDMGPQGIVERFSQIQPKVMFIESEVVYGGKRLDLRTRLKSAVEELKTRVHDLHSVVLISGSPWPEAGLITLSKFLDGPQVPLEFAQLPFDHPVYILYSSGTSGPPKCICHSAGGSLLKFKQDLSLSMDMSIDSVYYQYTTTGWMMWNVLIGALCNGTRILLYDGNPLYPSPSAQLSLLRDFGVTHWGTSPKFFSALMKDTHNRIPTPEALQAVLVAGAVLPLEVYTWFKNTFPEKIAFNNGSGGTDVLGCIIGGNNLTPVHGNELSAPALGMKVEVWDEDGRNIDASGEKGELVIVTPFPSMPLTFWGEGGVEKYRQAYFDVYPGIWTQGDLLSRDVKTKGYFIHGRSDGVLNPGGVRFGTAEIYGVLERFSEVEDFVVVGQRRPQDTDEQVLLFVKMKESVPLDDSLRSRIRQTIGTVLSRRHVPSHILQVKDIPYTLNGKRIEHVVKSIVNGDRPKVGNAIANPECLEEYKAFAKLPFLGTSAKL